MSLGKTSNRTAVAFLTTGALVALAGAGAHVLVNYRSNEDAAKETLRLIEEADGTGEDAAALDRRTRPQEE